MPVNKPCFGLWRTGKPALEPGDPETGSHADMLGDLVVGGLTRLYRHLYDESMVNPEFCGDFIAVRGACASLLPVKAIPHARWWMVQAEIERLRTEGVDPELLPAGEKPDVRRTAG